MADGTGDLRSKGGAKQAGTGFGNCYGDGPDPRELVVSFEHDEVAAIWQPPLRRKPTGASGRSSSSHRSTLGSRRRGFASCFHHANNTSPCSHRSGAPTEAATPTAPTRRRSATSPTPSAGPRVAATTPSSSHSASRGSRVTARSLGSTAATVLRGCRSRLHAAARHAWWLRIRAIGCGAWRAFDEAATRHFGPPGWSAGAAHGAKNRRLNARNPAMCRASRRSG
jgi:hypothetical protein